MTLFRKILGRILYAIVGAIFGFVILGMLPSQSPSRVSPRHQIKTPVGLLGYRLGKLITIEGYRATGPRRVTHTLMVDTIEGQRLEEPLAIPVEHEQGLPINTRISVRGYETGKWVGTPDEVVNSYPERGIAQVGLHFSHSFIVVDPITPNPLAAESSERPQL